ncbi:SDR family oxidoreductase [Limibaculum sp. M0105]|uniref:SDR family oxidoreductase n=1 Tax=Thermohalobaculum xanthum TaxID=2753746 RepID=A0A8J7M895_9RHOB|nr:SDR family oxidoreductase [Thermohalobaculum xanthum]MBK0400406.1 SDR family oxidoreductase [Thermohalobaculum xanthum]
MSHLKDKVAIVTGASRGIGAATARLMAEQGAAVILAARSTGETGALAAELTAAGHRAEAMACDVARFEDVAATVARARERFGGLDIVVNNAGMIEPIAQLVASDPAEWGQAIDVNLKGVYHGLRAAIPAMESGAVIVNISSGAAHSPLEGWSAYCAAKAGAAMLTRAAHLECAGRGIRVVGLSPGTVATQMQRSIKQSGLNPVSRLEWSDHIPPEWPARCIAWLCGPEGAEFAGTEVSLRDETIRRRVGLAA